MAEIIESLLTVEEVMKVLRISRPTLYRMLKSSTLQPVKIGKRTLFEVGDIKALIERSKGVPEEILQPKEKAPKEKGREKPARRAGKVKEGSTDKPQPSKEGKQAAGRKRQDQLEQPKEEQKEKQEKPTRPVEDDKQGRLL